MTKRRLLLVCRCLWNWRQSAFQLDPVKRTETRRSDSWSQEDETRKLRINFRSDAHKFLSLEYKNRWFAQDTRRKTPRPAKCSKGVSKVSSLAPGRANSPSYWIVWHKADSKGPSISISISISMSTACTSQGVGQMFKHGTGTMRHAAPQMCLLQTIRRSRRIFHLHNTHTRSPRIEYPPVHAYTGTTVWH